MVLYECLAVPLRMNPSQNLCLQASESTNVYGHVAWLCSDCCRGPHYDKGDHVPTSTSSGTGAHTCTTD
jgi:hypothetical protein